MAKETEVKNWSGAQSSTLLRAALLCLDINRVFSASTRGLFGTFPWKNYLLIKHKDVYLN